MGEFFVNVAAIDGLYDLIIRAGGDLDAALSYAREHADLSFPEQGPLWTLWGPHAHAYDAITQALADASVLTTSLGTAVNKAQVAYAGVDAAAAARLDALRPAMPRPPLPPAMIAGPPGSFLDLRAPRRHLAVVPPFPADPVFPASVFSCLTPSGVERLVCTTLLRWDPYEQFAVMLTGAGKWAAYARCSVVWRYIGDAVVDIAANLVRAAQDTPPVWRGNAADALMTFLLAVADALNGLAEACYFYSERYREAVDAIREITAFVADILGGLRNVIVMIAVTAALESVVPVIALYASDVLAFLIVAAIDFAGVAADAMASGLARIELVRGVLDAFHAAHSTRLPVLPAAPALS